MTDTPSSRMMALLEEGNEIVSELAVLRTKPRSSERSEMIRTRELLLGELHAEIRLLVEDLEGRGLSILLNPSAKFNLKVVR